MLNRLFVCLVAFITTNVLADDVTSTHGILDNGLTYYVKENHDKENRVLVQLVIKIGSFVETQDEKGSAYLFSQILKPENIYSSKMYTNNNAFTNYVATVYQCSMFAGNMYEDTYVDHQRCLNDVLSTINNRAFHADLSDVNVEKTKADIIQIMAVDKKNCEFLCHSPNWFNDTFFESHYPPVSQEELQKLSGDTIRTFYGKWYNPKFMAIIVVGDINKEKTVEAIKKYLSEQPTDMSNDSLNKEHENSIHISYNPRHEVIEKKSFDYQFAMKHITPIANQESLEENIKRELFLRFALDAMQDKLKTRLEEQYAFIVDIFNHYEFGNGLEMSKFGMACKDNELLPLIKYVSDQMRFLKNQGISYADMATIKDDLLQSLTFNMKYSGTHNDDYAEHYQELFLKGFPLIALEDKWRLQQQIMADLSLEEVNNFIRLFFDMSKWSCYMDLSEDSEKIDENKVKEILMAQ